mmetsp:Transcript_32863/g.93808  ORF Transcript_32863/g.93808 Transcript_32863/m.93808 type:complete len:361 (+) Transcript_32863:971-2053(+)
MKKSTRLREELLMLEVVPDVQRRPLSVQPSDPADPTPRRLGHLDTDFEPHALVTALWVALDLIHDDKAAAPCVAAPAAPHAGAVEQRCVEQHPEFPALPRQAVPLRHPLSVCDGHAMPFDRAVGLKHADLERLCAVKVQRAQDQLARHLHGEPPDLAAAGAHPCAQPRLPRAALLAEGDRELEGQNLLRHAQLADARAAQLAPTAQHRRWLRRRRPRRGSAPRALRGLRQAPAAAASHGEPAPTCRLARDPVPATDLPAASFRQAPRDGSVPTMGVEPLQSTPPEGPSATLARARHQAHQGPHRDVSVPPCAEPRILRQFQKQHGRAFPEFGAVGFKGSVVVDRESDVADQPVAAADQPG